VSACRRGHRLSRPPNPTSPIPISRHSEAHPTRRRTVAHAGSLVGLSAPCSERPGASSAGSEFTE
jgi:hypothetical protein